MPEDPFAAIAKPVSDPFSSIAKPVGASSQQTEAPKPSAYERLTAGYDPAAAEFGEKHPILDIPVRALSAAGGAVLGLPSAIYRTATEPVTEQEKKMGFTHRGPALFAGRTLVEPVVEAVKGYASGQITPKDALGVLPEALGVGVGTYAASEGLSKVGKLRLAAKEGFQPLARKVTGVEPAVKEAVTKAAEKQGEALSENRIKKTEAMKEGLKTQAEARTDIDRTKMAVGEKNKRIEAENRAQAEKVARRGELAKTVDQQSLQLGKHIENVEASVGKEANQKFDAVREQLGISEGSKGPEVPPEQLIATVKNIEENVLQGIPENIKEFRSILAHEGPPQELSGAVKEHYGWDMEGSEPLTWDKLQSIKSRLDTRLRKSRGMNGDLKRGLYQARDAVVNTMGEIADQHGAGDSWADARNFWRQYKEDFHEPTGPSGSGSPVAQSLDAVDPKNIRQPFLRTQATTGNRAIQILRKYPEHGGTEAATHAENLLTGHQEMMGLPEKESPKALKPVPEVFQLPERKPLPKAPEAPVVDVNKVAKDAIAQRAKNWGSFNARDIGILASGYLGGFIEHLFRGGGAEFPVAVTAYEGTKYAASRALNNPKVINWLAKTPPEEIAAIQKIPGADKVRIVNGLTKAAIEGADQSQVIPGGKYESSFTKSARPETNPSRFNSKTSDYDAHLLTLKDAKGVRIGSVSWHPAPGEPGVAEVHHSDLNPEYRGQGVGKEMYRQVIEDARRKGFKAIRADNEISPDAVRVWTSLGAKTVTDSLGRQRMQLDIPSVPPSISLSPEVRRLLGPANLARIAAVTGATQPKNPGEARDRMRQFATTP